MAMTITRERLGFFNTRLESRMSEVKMPARDFAAKVGSTYEHIRKLVMGSCLPSDSMLERLCLSLGLSKRKMGKLLQKDKMIFQFGDAAWRAAGIDPGAAPVYILFPLLSRRERKLFVFQLKAFAERSKRDQLSGQASTTPSRPNSIGAKGHLPQQIQIRVVVESVGGRPLTL